MLKYGTFSIIAFYGGFFQLNFWTFLALMAFVSIRAFFWWPTSVVFDFVYMPINILMYQAVGWFLSAHFLRQTPLLGPESGWVMYFKIFFFQLFVIVTRLTYQYVFYPVDCSVDWAWFIVYPITYYLMFINSVWDYSKENKGYQLANQEEKKKMEEEKIRFSGFLKHGFLVSATLSPAACLFFSNALMYLQSVPFFAFADDLVSNGFRWIGVAVIALIIWAIYGCNRQAKSGEVKEQ